MGSSALKRNLLFLGSMRFVLIVTYMACWITSPLLAQDVQFPARILQAPKTYGDFFDQSFEAREMDQYFPDTTHAIILENGYASALLRNPEAWKPTSIGKVDTIEVIFSLYPSNPEFWITNYHVLLARRLGELFRIAPSLNRSDIQWQLVLQNDCENEPEAIGLFHGFRIVYTPREVVECQPVPEAFQNKPTSLSYIDSLFTDSSRISPLVVAVDTFIQAKGGYQDSAVLHILSRNRQWENALVVLDWTGSMYHHGAMAVLWHLLHLEDTNMDHFVFFNDGNDKPNRKKQAGSTGGIVTVPGTDLEKLVAAFAKVERRGDGGDSPENDVEAMLRGMRKFPEFGELILVADNYSCMRDFTLYEKIGVPVRILLPGHFTMINHHYVNLAYKTGGSIHTFDRDIYDFAENAPESLTIDGVRYFRNMFDLYQCEQPVSYRFCNAFYGIKRYSLRTKPQSSTSAVPAR